MIESLNTALRNEHLFVSATLRENGETIYLISPDEPGFWAHVTASAEFADGERHPLDRWSARVIDPLAKAHGGRALYPFGEPRTSFVPLILGSGQAFSSPIFFMVHARMGLMASYRGAIAVPGDHALLPEVSSPCLGCAAPCLAACPIGAFSEDGYDVKACYAYLDGGQGDGCSSGGCLSRRACPVNAGYDRLPEQSAWHMRQRHIR
ncbi:hypothetical protein [Celeribacter neptunius]|uniref:4Fe-4S ferredoxin-type domain-containing protein n=1 Tax=Celeribacter neptunius TaxID=588602 RepID=A0A1I3KLE8_9RHOB|nr:hypothetical protein [Celeribacter neptunius]SFI73170.1 hypothetical protein SAMN04487991_0726 [Celeribacter neptunius]